MGRTFLPAFARADCLEGQGWQLQHQQLSGTPSRAFQGSPSALGWQNSVYLHVWDFLSQPCSEVVSKEAGRGYWGVLRDGTAANLELCRRQGTGLAVQG